MKLFLFFTILLVNVSFTQYTSAKHEDHNKIICTQLTDSNDTILLEPKSENMDKTIYNFTLGNQISLVRSYFERLGLVNEDGTINCVAIIHPDRQTT